MLRKITTHIAALAIIASGFTTINIAPASANIQCQNYATSVADSAGSRGGNTLGGAALGAAAGAIIGGAFGRPGRGAAIGSVAGGTAGFARGSRQWQAYYNNAYNDCMRRNVAAPVYGGGCIARPEWLHQQCQGRYRSYDRCSGTFQPYNGPRRLCN